MVNVNYVFKLVMFGLRWIVVIVFGGNCYELGICLGECCYCGDFNIDCFFLGVILF